MPDSKTLGQTAYETWIAQRTLAQPEITWASWQAQNPANRSLWEAVAMAIINQYTKVPGHA